MGVSRDTHTHEATTDPGELTLYQACVKADTLHARHGLGSGADD